MTLTPTQRAICAVIRENGGWLEWYAVMALDKLSKKGAYAERRYYANKPHQVSVDDQKVTKKEYEQWLNQ